MVGGVWWHQERIAYQPPAESPTPPAGVSRIEYVADDGQRLYGYVIDPLAQRSRAYCSRSTATPISRRGRFRGRGGRSTNGMVRPARGVSRLRRTSGCADLCWRPARCASRLARGAGHRTTRTTRTPPRVRAVRPLARQRGRDGAGCRNSRHAPTSTDGDRAAVAVHDRAGDGAHRFDTARCRCCGGSSRECTTTLARGSTRSTRPFGFHTGNATGSFPWRWDASCSPRPARPASCSSSETPGITMSIDRRW